MDDHTRDAAREAINEVKIRCEQVLALLDRHPDNVLALESAAVWLKQATLILECPEET